MKLGLGDPADTGILFGVITPLFIFTGSSQTIKINIQPDFERENLEGHAGGALRVYPVRFIKPVILFVFSMTTLKALKAMIAARGK
jgi:hypothetical protein